MVTSKSKQEHSKTAKRHFGGWIQKLLSQKVPILDTSKGITSPKLKIVSDNEDTKESNLTN